ncbi:MAG: DUF3048 domain-containing protein [Eubacterium sp.]|nr:DUF3048 domain-containing protein [Eubacterium sp.]
MYNKDNEFEDGGVSFNEWQGNDSGNMNKSKKNKTILIAVIAVVAVIAIVCGVYFGCFYGKGEEERSTAESSSSLTTEAPVVITNPLTGEADYNAEAVGKRPIAVVIDNASGARPQYNIDTPDIIVEGEVEGGETRLLWLYADMTNLPEMVGPNRSARPSYVQFSELFDSIFVHFGGSHSKGSYVGGYEVIAQDNVDDIDGMTVSSCFKRTSDKVSPHNAVLLGDKLVEAIESKNYRTDIKESSFSALSFNENVSAVSDTVCNSVKVKISSRTATRTLIYNSAEQVYVNESDYRTPVSFTNVIVMFAESTYIDKDNYKGSGQTETYLNYSLTSGRGQLISCGTVVDFNWSVDNGKLSFKDLNGNELNLNPGRSWICLASSNHEGNVTIE